MAMETVNFSGKKLYLILWGGAALIISGMFLINQWQLGTDSSAENGIAISKQFDSDDEMNISAKNSFINLLLRSDYAEELPVQQDYRPKSIYNKEVSLYLRNPVHNRQPEDFSVGPVPK